MRFVRSAYFVLLFAACALRAQTSIPVLVQPLPTKLDIGPAGLTVDLRTFFVVPGITGTQIVQFDTVVGRFNVDLRTDVAPRHVANFLSYVQAGTYTNTFIHRAASFDNGAVSIVQGGGYGFNVPFQLTTLPRFTPIALEYNLANARGTLAAARTNDINSATSEWYFNVRDNSTILNQSNGGGYSVFGRVMGTGMTVVDAMAALPRFNASQVSPVLTDLPLRNVSGGSFNETNLIVINSVRPVTLFPTGVGTSVITFSVQSSNPAIVTGVITGSSLFITPVDKGAATLTVRATDTNGNSVALMLNAALVEASEPPVYSLQPRSQTVAAGTTAVLSATATGAESYRWERNGVAVTGATSSTLVLSATSAANAGAYVSVATNTTGTTRSNPAVLTVVALPAVDRGRLVNLSILTSVGAGAKVLTMGAFVGPGDSTGALPLVIRAVGPTLAQPPFNVPGVLADPVMTLYAAGNGTPLESNDNWGGSPALAAAFASVAAFALPAASLDSALVRPAPGVAPGGYTIQVVGKGTASGACIAEMYDASGSARTAATPRLINLSTRALIDANSDLAVGFVIGGQSARTVIVRGVGPSLAVFGVTGLMEDPRLELFDNSTSQRIAGNDDWAGSPEIAAASNSVGAFALSAANSKDAVLILTLPPGPYSARISGANGAGGVALVEVYEVP